MQKKRRKGRPKLEKVIYSTRFIVLVLVVIALGLGYVRIRFEETKIGYDISINEKEILTEKRFLQADYMKLKSPHRIEKLARELGFKFPTHDDVMYIEQPTVVGENR